LIAKPEMGRGALIAIIMGIIKALLWIERPT
jgi:hypothetical protein